MTDPGTSDTHASPLSIALSAAVPLHIMDLKARGGPTGTDYEEARAFGSVLAEQGDRLLFRATKKKDEGQAASLFNRLARSLAVMAWLPGGSRFGELRWCADDGGAAP